jgi:hypothetical protein
MATPRITSQTVRSSKTLNDFPNYLSAADKLAEVSEPLSQAEHDLKSALESPQEAEDERVRAEAQAELAGDTATAVLPSVAQLRHRCRVMAEKVRQQTSILERERIAAAREISAEMLPAYRAAVSECIQMMTAAFAAYDKICATAAATRKACDGVCLLPDLAINPHGLNQFQHHFGTFKLAAREMLDVAGGQ